MWLVISILQRTPSRLLTAADSGPTGAQHTQELLVYWEVAPQAKTQPIYLLLAPDAQWMVGGEHLLNKQMN